MPAMFGMGMGEIILIAIVALLVVGPDKLPGAAKAIGKGIRDLRASTKDLQSTIEQDTQIGEAVRELKGALRGDPETLYKRATGEDFRSPKKTGSTSESSAETSAETSSKDSEAEASDSPSAGPSSQDQQDPTPDEPISIIDEAYANVDDGWGSKPHNPHDEEENRTQGTDSDPDLPAIKKPAGSIARGQDADEQEDSEANDSNDGRDA